MYRALVVVGLLVPFAAHADTPTAPTDEPTAPMLRMQHGLREKLADLGEALGLRVPDVSVLRVQPLLDAPDSWATSGFGWRDDPIRHYRKFHSGADVRARSGTPVFAAGDGVVTFAGRQGGYGNVIYVDHGGGVITRYAHLRRIETKKNALLTAGTRIGQVGRTGRATGSHLHFEVRIDGHPVAPQTALIVAELQRDAPAEGRLAAYALTPELQALEHSDLDPPKVRRARTKKPTESRPERKGRTKRVRPTS
jgi:murein DD-endopeptidase MepM/ murein hydrolase activator NlpD